MNYVEGKLNGIPTVSELMDEVKKCEDGLDNKLNKNDLIAGENIEITDNEQGKKVISCTAEGKVYTAGDGINISDEDVISFDTNVLNDYATKEEIPDVSNFVTNENLETTLQDYAKESEIPTDYVTKSTKIGGVEIQDGINDIKNLSYGKEEKMVSSLVEGKEYTLPTTYDLSQFEVEDGTTYVYTEVDPYLEMGVYTDEIYKCIYIETNDDYKEYNQNSNQWVLWDENLNEYVPCASPTLTLHLNYIVTNQEELLKQILGVEDTKQLVDVTLDDELKGYTNWEYENNGVGIFDVPKWDVLGESQESRAILYDDKAISINFDKEFLIEVFIYDEVNSKGYGIFSEDYVMPETIFKANTWFTWDLSGSAMNIVECNTPEFILDLANVKPSYKDLFDAVYGQKIVTLKQKIDGIEKTVNNIEPLKDKIYDGEEGILEDGKSYSISDNFVEFFNKYSNGQSTLLYGTMEEVEPLTELEGVKPKGNTKAPVEVVGAETIEITGIYLYTDSSPVIKEGTKAGGISLLGGASLELYTSQGTLNYFQDGTSWMYNEFEIPVNQLPSLVLDINLVRNEQMLKDFLKITNTLQTLEDKFNEVEHTLLKDKTYDYIEDGDLEEEHKYSFKTNLSDFFTKGYEYQDIYDINGGGVTPVSFQSLGKGKEDDFSGIEKEEYVTFITYNYEYDFDTLKKYIEIVTNVYNYIYFENEGAWTVDGLSMTPPDLTYISEYVLNEDMLKDILNLITPQTLEQKLDSIEAPYSIVDFEETSGTLNSITVKNKETGESSVLTVGGGGKQLYQHNISIYSSGSYDYTIMVISDNGTQVQSNNDLINLLKNNMNKTIIAIGTYQDSGTKNITKAMFINENNTYKMQLFTNLSSSVKWQSYNVAEDSVITL